MMRTSVQTISTVVDGGLCMGCGICTVVCQAEAINMRKCLRTGIILPEVNDTRCIACGRCIQVCPGAEVDFASLTKWFLNRDYSNELLGIYETAYFSHANDHEIRFRSSSGGLVTALLLRMLETGHTHGALVARMDPVDPLQVECFLAKTKNEILSASGSKYCPVSIGSALRQILHVGGRYAIVGLPCHIHGVRKLEQINPEVCSHIIAHFGLVCRNTCTYKATEYFLKGHGIDPQLVTRLSYRGSGWPGRITIETRDRFRHEFLRSANVQNLHNRVIMTSAFLYDFLHPRCLVCADFMNELADISFGDPWHRDVLRQETVGKSLVIVRTKTGKEIIEDARANGIISIEPISETTILASQGYGFKKGFRSRILVRRYLRRPVPRYPGKSGRLRIRSLFSFAMYIGSLCSHREGIWPLIRLYAWCRHFAVAVAYGGVRRALCWQKAPTRSK